MIVGIGELLWDVFPDGRKVAGGAPFNFAFHCRQLGHPAAIVSRVGDDDLGRELREEVLRLGLPDEFVQTDRKRPTGAAHVTFDPAGQPTYRFVTDPAWGHIEWTDALAATVRGSAAVCHGTLALLESKTGANTVLKAAGLKSVRGKRDGLTVYDANLRGRAMADRAIDSARWIKLNEEELPAFETRLDAQMDDDPWPRTMDGYFAYLRHFTKMENRLLIVTRGEAGAELIGEGFHHRERGVPATVVDTVGAGDAFTAAMVCLRLEGRPLPQCARFAVHYAARICEHQGATPRIDRADVERAAFGR